MRRERGIALVNALVIVAAISALASGLMLRAETSRARLGQAQGTGQGMLYLDAAEMLLAPRLRADWAREQGLDHLRELWALQRIDVETGRGNVTGDLADLQGRFNVNWLANGADPGARQAFDRLLRRRGLPLALTRTIAGFVSASGPADMDAYTARDLPVAPARAPLEQIEDLRLVEGMTQAAYDRLRPLVAALPPGTSLNVNTAPAEVLGAFLPAARPAAVENLVRSRDVKPFETVGEFGERVERMVHRAALDAVDTSRFGIATEWFEAELRTGAPGEELVRRVTLHRSRLNGEVRVTLRRAVLP